MDSTARTAAPPVRSCLLLAAVASVLGALLAAIPAVHDARSDGTLGHVTDVYAVVGAALFVGAGVLRVARWRITRDRRSLLMGVALIVLGGLAMPLTSVAGVIMGQDEQSLLRALTAVLTTGVAVVLVVGALNGRNDQGGQPVVVLLGATAAAVALFGAAGGLHAWMPHVLHTEDLSPRVLRGSLLAAAWLMVACEAAMRGRERPWARQVAPLLACMGVAELLRVVAVYRPDAAWELAGAALVSALAAVAAHRALTDLDEAAYDVSRRPSGDVQPVDVHTDPLHAVGLDHGTGTPAPAWASPRTTP